VPRGIRIVFVRPRRIATKLTVPGVSIAWKRFKLVLPQGVTAKEATQLKQNKEKRMAGKRPFCLRFIRNRDEPFSRLWKSLISRALLRPEQ
jgi:hypothetical protein